MSFFWNALSSLLPQTVEKPHNSQQLFELGLLVLRAMGPDLRDDLDLASCIHQWSNLLLTHKHEEVGGDILFALVKLTCLSSLEGIPSTLLR